MIKEAFGNNNNFSFDLFFLDTVLKDCILIKLHTAMMHHMKLIKEMLIYF